MVPQRDPLNMKSNPYTYIAYLIPIFGFFRPSDSVSKAEKIRAQFLHRRNMSACLQLRLICTCFIIGYVPLSAYPIWATAIPHKKCTGSIFVIDYWIGVVAYIILRISECLNPMMYNLGCREMRRATTRFLHGRATQRSDSSFRATTHSDILLMGVATLHQHSPSATVT